MSGTHRRIQRNIGRCACTLVVAGSMATALLLTGPSRAQNFVKGKANYRGFTIDVTAVPIQQQTAAAKTSTLHQFDIAADSGVKPEIMRFFQSQAVFIKPESGMTVPGLFDGKIVTIRGMLLPQQKPIVLHELLHAFHGKVMPDGSRNADIAAFYQRAIDNKLYPAREYLLSNRGEFFAVTASLYLWGNVDIEPHTREKLKATQPVYYTWLGELFGVKN